MIATQEILNRAARIQAARFRQYIYARSREGALSDEQLESLFPTGFWRHCGFERLLDYLEIDLDMPHARALKLLTKATEAGDERFELYVV